MSWLFHCIYLVSFFYLRKSKCFVEYSNKKSVPLSRPAINEGEKEKITRHRKCKQCNMKVIQIRKNPLILLKFRNKIKQVMLKLLRHMQLPDNIKGNRNYNFLGNYFMSFLHRSLAVIQECTVHLHFSLTILRSLCVMLNLRGFLRLQQWFWCRQPAKISQISHKTIDICLICVCLSVCLSLYLLFRLSAGLFFSFSLYVCPYICLSVCLAICLAFCLAICVSVCLCVCLSACLSACLCVFLSVCLLSVCLCLSVCLSICLSVSVCLSFRDVAIYFISKYKIFRRMFQLQIP